MLLVLLVLYRSAVCLLIYLVKETPCWFLCCVQLRAFQPGRYVANLGHGMEPQMSPRKLGVFLQAVKDTAAEIKKKQTENNSPRS